MGLVAGQVWTNVSESGIPSVTASGVTAGNRLIAILLACGRPIPGLGDFTGAVDAAPSGFSSVVTGSIGEPSGDERWTWAGASVKTAAGTEGVITWDFTGAEGGVSIAALTVLEATAVGAVDGTADTNTELACGTDTTAGPITVTAGALLVAASMAMNGSAGSWSGGGTYVELLEDVRFPFSFGATSAVAIIDGAGAGAITPTYAWAGSSSAPGVGLVMALAASAPAATDVNDRRRRRNAALLAR
jgi:hypothetical protein